MIASKLLKSCATPPASWPTTCIFCAWRRRSSLAPRAISVRRRSSTIWIVAWSSRSENGFSR